MDKHERERIENWKRARSICGICGEHFCEIANVGSWKCGQHVGEIANGVYTCCGAARRYGPHRFTKGCVSADHNALPAEPGHTPSPYTYRHDESMTQAGIVALIGVNPRAIVTSTRGDYFFKTTVRRFDDPNLAMYA